MKILQVQFKNRNGHTLRGIVTLPDTEGKVPFVVHLHGFAGSCSGYKMCIRDRIYGEFCRKGEKAAKLQREKKKALTGCRAATARAER